MLSRNPPEICAACDAVKLIDDKYFSKRKIAEAVKNDFRLVTEDQILSEVMKLRKYNKIDSRSAPTKTERADALDSIKAGIIALKDYESYEALLRDHGHRLESEY